MIARARRVLERADLLASFSEEDDCLARPYGTTSLVEASAQVALWMAEAGMTVRRDAVGNVIGRVEPSAASVGTFVLGSHLDSVRDAGRYDGPLGVLAAIEVIEETCSASRPAPLALEAVSFADEEGLRFQTAYLGSRAYAGLLSGSELAIEDEDGILLEEGIRAMGGDPAALASPGSAPADLLGYLEVHIEQGRMLQDEGLPVGIVTEIVGQSRGTASFVGGAGHAGTTPMTARRDALAGAAAFVLEVERVGRERDGLTATVGWIANEPNVVNVIPGRATVSYDLRHQVDAERERARDGLAEAAAAISAERGLELEWRPSDDETTVPMSKRLRAILARACAESGLPALELSSAAGHDAVPLAQLTPEVAMLFVRCRNGISHHPDESVCEDDVAAVLAVASRFVRLAGEEAALP
jgi:allantoate deiminase